MRTLGPIAEMTGGPRIAYPPAGARIELRAREAVSLAAFGGDGRLRWLVDGRPIDGTTWIPEGSGEARVAVIDRAGRASAVTVQIVRRP
jgi:penicillin-binding protein 1C